MLAVRALAMIETAPLISSDSNPQVAKVALAGFTAFSALPSVPASFITADMYTLSFAFMLVGEAIIGIILGFYLTMIYSAFSAAGQFFSLQMGFGASETFDPLAQIENPLLGQFLNLIAMLVFLTVDGFQNYLGAFSIPPIVERSLSYKGAGTNSKNSCGRLFFPFSRRPHIIHADFGNPFSHFSSHGFAFQGSPPD